MRSSTCPVSRSMVPRVNMTRDMVSAGNRGGDGDRGGVRQGAGGRSHRARLGHFRPTSEKRGAEGQSGTASARDARVARVDARDAAEGAFSTSHTPRSGLPGARGRPRGPPPTAKSSSRPRCGQGSRFAGQIRVGRGARRARERARVRGSTHLRLVSLVRRSCTSRGAEAERAEVVRAPRCATPTSPTKHSSCWARTKCKTPEPVTCGSGLAVCENILGFTTRRFAPTPRTGGIRTIFSEIFHPRASSVVRTRGSVTSAKCAHARGDRRFAREVEDDGGCHRVRGRDGIRTLVRGRGRVRRVGRVRRARGARGCR